MRGSLVDSTKRTPVNGAATRIRHGHRANVRQARPVRCRPCTLGLLLRLELNDVGHSVVSSTVPRAHPLITTPKCSGDPSSPCLPFAYARPTRAQFSQKSDTRCWRVRPPQTDRMSFPLFPRQATGAGARLINEWLLRDRCRNMEGGGRKTFAMVDVCRVLPVVPSVVSIVFTGDIFVENPVICFPSIVCHKYPLDPLRPWFVSFTLLTVPNVRLCPYPHYYH